MPLVCEVEHDRKPYLWVVEAPFARAESEARSADDDSPFRAAILPEQLPEAPGDARAANDGAGRSPQASPLRWGELLDGPLFHGDHPARWVLFLAGALGLGIFISAVLKSQVLATQAAMVATYLPALLLSGFLFDIRAMPTVLQAVTYVVPARYFVAVTRGVLLKGVGFDVLWLQGVFMLGFALLGLSLATIAFRKRIAS